MPFEPSPGTGELDEDPMFLDAENWDFRVDLNSPAVASGRYGDTRGALPFGVTGIDDDENRLPSQISLFPAYPNPFNAFTVLTFEFPELTKYSLEIFNLRGQRVEMLANNEVSNGFTRYIWDAAEFSSGVYFYKLSAGDKVFTKRMTLLK